MTAPRADEEGRCPSTFTFQGMQTVFECQNPPDIPAEPHNERPAWKHLHGRWHHFEDVDADGDRFRVEWQDGHFGGHLQDEAQP